MTAGLIGLTVTYTLRLTGTFNWLVRQVLFSMIIFIIIPTGVLNQSRADSDQKSLRAGPFWSRNSSVQGQLGLRIPPCWTGPTLAESYPGNG